MFEHHYRYFACRPESSIQNSSAFVQLKYSKIFAPQLLKMRDNMTMRGNDMTNEPREEEDEEEEEEEEEEEGEEEKSATLPCQSSKAYTKGNLATI